MPRRSLLFVALGLLAPGFALAAGPICLATFNIHHAEGADGVIDVGRVADVVKGADVVALQEVDVRFGPRSRLEDQAAALGARLGLHVAFGGNLKSGTGAYGVALLSRFPIVASRNHPLPRAAGRETAEPRGLLETALDVDGRRLRVFVTHLAHDSAEDRRLQVDAVRALVNAGEGPAILMGDLNFRPEDPLHARLLAPPEGSDRPLLVDTWTRAGTGAGHSIGLAGPRPGRIDYILATPDLAPGFADARVDTETRASDHQPVFIRLQPTAGR
jgi:endonuclease/exonuclease/phosphatase family metal-dependent hydrolase